MANAGNIKEVERRMNVGAGLAAVFVTGRAERAPRGIGVCIRLHHGLISELIFLIYDGSIK